MQSIAIDIANIESTKYDAMLQRINDSPGVGLVYSQFVGFGGLGSFSMYLMQHNWSQFNPKTPAATQARASTVIGDALERRIFAVISGEVEIEDRATITSIFNSADNRNGSNIALLLVSSTGAEGLDLHRIRHIHIMEPYWNTSRINQIIARGVRNNSHIDLNLDEKNVQPYIYLSVAPEGELDKLGNIPTTTDLEIYETAIQHQLIINTFLDAIKEVSVECAANAGENCLICSPTDEMLFTRNAEVDAYSRNNCKVAVNKKIKATPITLNNRRYYYVQDSTALRDYKIYVEASDIGGYTELADYTDEFMDVLNSIQTQVGASV